MLASKERAKGIDMQPKAFSDYNRGRRVAARDIHECGSSYARERYAYGLQGESTAFCKGYRQIAFQS